MKSPCHSQLANGPLSGLCFCFSLEFIGFLTLESNSFLHLYPAHVGITAPGGSEVAALLQRVR